MAKTLIGNVKGPKGDKGDKGATGATGPAGATGAQGPKGDTGAAFTYDMFTAAQLAALKGPTGATGPKGDKGDKGDTGPAGAAGAAGQPGEDGQRGTGILNATSGVSSYTTAVGGVTPAYRILLSTLKTQAKVDEVLVGDSVRYSYFIYPVIYVDDTYAYMGTRVSIRGATGAAGAAGADGAAGAPGAAATIEAVTAEVDGSYLAQPTVNVTPGGTPSNRTFHFAFKGLRGLSGGGSGGGGTTVQADLSVNDPNDPSYVKERTHWKEVFDGPEGEVIPETSLVFNGNFNFGQLSGMSAGVQIGGKYIVTHNGTDYECVGRDSGDGAYIGNGSLLGYGNLANTGEPFCILAFGGTVYYLYKANTTAETITVKVVGKKETVWHKLEGGYLPDGVPYVETGIRELMPEATYEVEPGVEGALPDVVDVKVGDTVTVKWNGVEYACTAELFPSPELPVPCIGDIDMLTTGEPTGVAPFIMVFLDAATAAEMGAGTMIVSLDEATSVTLSISGESKVVNKLSAELLPDGAPGIEPFDDVIMASFPTAVVEGDFFSDPVGTVIAGAVYRVNWGGTVYECVARHDSEQDLYLLGNGRLPNGDDFGTEHPFLIFIYGPASQWLSFGVTCSVGTRDDTTDDIKNNFSVVGAYKVQRINEYCMPRNYAPVVVHFDRNNNPDVPWDAAYQAIVEGRNVTAHSVNQSSVLYQVFGAAGGEIVFNAIHFIGNTLYLEQISWNAPDISGAAVETLQTKLATT